MMILHEKCDPKLADDTKLPYTAYLVQYDIDGAVYRDLFNGSFVVYDMLERCFAISLCN